MVKLYKLQLHSAALLRLGTVKKNKKLDRHCSHSLFEEENRTLKEQAAERERELVK